MGNFIVYSGKALQPIIPSPHGGAGGFKSGRLLLFKSPLYMCNTFTGIETRHPAFRASSLANRTVAAAPQVWNWLETLDGRSAQVPPPRLPSSTPTNLTMGGCEWGRQGRGDLLLPQASPDMRIKLRLLLPTSGPDTTGEDDEQRPLTPGTSGRPKGLCRRLISSETISYNPRVSFSGAHATNHPAVDD